MSRQSVLKHGVVDTQLCAGGAVDIDVGMVSVGAAAHCGLRMRACTSRARVSQRSISPENTDYTVNVISNSKIYLWYIRRH